MMQCNVAKRDDGVAECGLSPGLKRTQTHSPLYRYSNVGIEMMLASKG